MQRPPPAPTPVFEPPEVQMLPAPYAGNPWTYGMPPFLGDNRREIAVGTGHWYGWQVAIPATVGLGLLAASFGVVQTQGLDSRTLPKFLGLGLTGLATVYVPAMVVHAFHGNRTAVWSSGMLHAVLALAGMGVGYGLQRFATHEIDRTSFYLWSYLGAETLACAFEIGVMSWQHPNTRRPGTTPAPRAWLFPQVQGIQGGLVAGLSGGF